ncbi:unnamed protein product [Prorocentrum cordatum]|uniref:Protein S-acyltransferase n=1 Tax=Prorocentrum cordatum TaxID=2364126 RepID=A0ABN9Q9C5_9DINO|nr:unnamed protein product [Polarella glacialis]
MPRRPPAAPRSASCPRLCTASPSPRSRPPGTPSCLWAVVSSMLAVILAPFLGLHCWLIANNLTTLEFFENRSKRRGAAISPYSIDIVHNLAVLGDDPLKWLLPIGKPPGDGTWYAQASWAQGEAGAEDAAGAASSAAGAAATASASAPAAGGAPAAAGAPAAGGEPGDGLETGAPSSAAGSSAAAAAAPGLPGGGLAWCAGLLPPARAAFETTVKATKATVARAAPPVTELCADAKELVSVCWRAFRKDDDDEVEADTLQTLVRRRPRPPSAD